MLGTESRAFALETQLDANEFTYIVMNQVEYWLQCYNEIFVLSSQ